MRPEHPDQAGPDTAGTEAPARGADQLGDVLRDAEDAGFTAQITVEDEPLGTVRCSHCDRTSAVGDVERVWSHRLEGASDPDDMLHVSALRCPHCGSGGVLVCHFGPEASAAEAEVLRQLRPT